ncbi:GrpB family protein [Streptomyces sp. NPDC087440]|uniref:GrpB family protein n=1 Tax=Streptomyces sp. NPDC087440 TaxID=3365790 RepID=UPI0037F701ED
MTETPPPPARDSAPVLVPYSPAWQPQGRALTQELLAALAPLAERVEHIGSTAIPGMAAKAVFDLQVSVADLAAAEAAFAEPLAARGFRLSPYRNDHVPAGLDDDPANWTKRLWTRRSEDGASAVNLHVRRTGSPNERLALLFRDWFRAHPEAIPSYARFKQSLADAVDSTGVYADVKDPVVDLVITVAEPWAAQTAWKPTAPSTD